MDVIISNDNALARIDDLTEKRIATHPFEPPGGALVSCIFLEREPFRRETREYCDGR